MASVCATAQGSCASAHYDDTRLLPLSPEADRTLTLRLYAPQDYRADMEKTAPDALNKYKPIWPGCGTGDPMWYQPNKAISQWLDKNNVKHVWREIPGAHVWPVWREIPAESAPLLFAQNGKR